MPRTKLCNYLYVRLKTILTSANACALRSDAIRCDAYLCSCVAAHLHTCADHERPPVFVCARSLAHAKKRARVCVRGNGTHHGASRLSNLKPTSGIYHGLLSYLAYHTTTINHYH